MNIAEICMGFLQDGFNAGCGRGTFDEKKNMLDAREVANDFGEGPGNGSELAGPVGEFVGPTEKCALVQFPFGRHVKMK